VVFAARLASYAKAAGVDLAVTPELEAAVADFVLRARASWPELQLPEEAFLQHVGARLAVEDDPVAVLDSLHAGDLYLACACSRGDARAIAALEREFVSQISAYLSRSDALAGFANEVKQAVRERILVARDSILPRIESYNGRGPLGGWLRIVTARIATDLRRAQRREGRQREPAPLPRDQPDPELAYLKQRYGREFETALEKAFQELDAKESNLLRLHFLDGLAAPAIAPMYGVSARTIQRWIADAQSGILARVRRTLSERLKVSVHELDSLLGLVRSQLDISFHRFMNAPDGD
jgi:RNA polymerase sigma-70 factor (ECF subfamily)